MDKFTDRILSLEAVVIEHYRRLDEESIWLFVAIIGCWSISVSWVQLLALAIIFYFLYRNVFDGLNLNSSYSRELKDIRKEIDSSELDQEQIECLWGKIWKVESEYLTIFQSLKLNVKFILSMSFFGVSLFCFIM